jgi:protein-S-isoprenylcysteine O-methyltransferase Ste14
MWHWLFVGPWIVFALWWIVRAFGAARTEKRESAASRLGYGVVLIAGVVLMAHRWHGVLATRLWPPSYALACVALAMEVGGIAFAIWAREHLGRLWSGTITLKQDHRIVRSGPYRLARHPIYTGILFGLSGVALVRGDVASLAAMVLFVAGIARKIVLEERLLVAHFGDEYRDYRRQVRALIPFVL